MEVKQNPDSIEEVTVLITTPASNSKAVIISIERFRADHFISLVEAGHKTKQDRFRTTGGNYYLIMIHINFIRSIIAHELAPVTFIAGAMAIFENFKV